MTEADRARGVRAISMSCPHNGSTVSEVQTTTLWSSDNGKTPTFPMFRSAVYLGSIIVLSSIRDDRVGDGCSRSCVPLSEPDWAGQWLASHMHCALVLYHTDSVDPADLDQRTAVKFMSVSCENFYPGRIKSAAFPSKYGLHFRGPSTSVLHLELFALPSTVLEGIQGMHNVITTSTTKADFNNNHFLK